MNTHPSLALIVATTLAACSPGQPAGSKAPTADVAPTYDDPAQGFAIILPAGMQVRHDFQRSYLGDASWKALAGDDPHGTPVVALVLAGSNAITAAELRVGTGNDAAALAHCLDVPDSGMPADTQTVDLAGTSFTRFHAGDAAMSHYLRVEGYRAIHDGRCYAIDLLLTGTRPEVYDPPATPPFSQDEAMRQLHDALAGFRFLTAD